MGETSEMQKEPDRCGVGAMAGATLLATVGISESAGTLLRICPAITIAAASWITFNQWLPVAGPWHP